MGGFSNPRLYEKLRKHEFETPEQAEEAFEAFMDEVYKLREKYKLKDVVVVAEVFARGETPESKKALDMCASAGDSMMRGHMLSIALANEVGHLTLNLGRAMKAVTRLMESAGEDELEHQEVPTPEKKSGPMTAEEKSAAIEAAKAVKIAEETKQ
jgi:hypothetical protein